MSDSAFPPGSVLLLDLLRKRSALFFAAPFEIVICHRLEDVRACLAKLEAAQRDGAYAAGYLAYELGYAFEETLVRNFKATGEPLLWFGLYDRAEPLTLDAARAMLTAAGGEAPRICDAVFDMDRATYGAAFERVRGHLAKGDIYQVNLTLRAAFRYLGAPERLFEELMRRQPVEFAAFVRTTDRTVLSLSPELFLERQGSLLRARPMKGTAPRGRYPSEDAAIAIGLAKDPKQRAENTMIVDLMRNDLSRVAGAGTVTVTKLCEVERYRSVHQMTSTVEARASQDTGFAAMIERLFPCGSITGAPKLSAMRIARDLESAPRGVYTGAIGHLEPGGDFRLNVAIRTLVLRDDGSGEAGTGSGVVFDSGAAPEYDECLLKLKFMTQATPRFELIETMAFDPADGYLLLERHLLRLQASAAYFDFHFDRQAVEATLSDRARLFRGAQRVRLLLGADGGISVTATALAPSDGAAVVTLALAGDPVSSTDRFLFHKTTNRAFLDDTRKSLQARTGCQEVLFCNENGFLTEGSYTTLFVKRNGRLMTPALGHGLLPGTLRAGLLERGLAVEADLTPEDLFTAEEIFVGNSVRGLFRARLLEAEGRMHDANLSQADPR
ncbi:aminodeoxychorismate synthase component I [Roseibium marinum]|uniref:Probable branched-chain-amino-acid aminotransferase n=1 Tax=Roseibium marinum TaxID=281252 RepID=A0A2S3V333_9HYPH|nr:aminodeoxychorismate synthase component I [Roseibium marinum]POF34371.1 para-aminobenzoate synthetase/4-amino-4-deoxychorismate lyase [Roseibium marinum]